MTPAASGQLGNKVKGQGDGARTHFRAPQEGRGSCRRGCPQSDARCRFQLTRPAAVTTAREHETFACEGPLPLWLPSSPFTRRQPLRSGLPARNYARRRHGSKSICSTAPRISLPARTLSPCESPVSIWLAGPTQHRITTRFPRTSAGCSGRSHESLAERQGLANAPGCSGNGTSGLTGLRTVLI
jgi:hypothetical protein